jgi:ornithine cyclodeaminase
MLRVIEREEIASVLELENALACIERSFRLFSQGRVTAPPVTHLGFSEPAGDSHIKAAHIHGEPIFAVKVSNGFYQNPSRGLPSSNGLVMVFCADTGTTLAVLDDRGLITDMRTALAGVVALTLARPDGFGTVGIVGAGTQARLQLEYLHRLRGPLQARVWSRSAEELKPYLQDIRAKGVDVEARDDLQKLCSECDVLVTTTPATSPLVDSSWVPAGTHITAVGADAEGKQELDPELFRRARGVLVDSRDQCVDHAEVSHAVRAGLVKPGVLVEIGEALAGQDWQLNVAGDITIADLSGLGASDAMMAQAVWAAVGDAD